MGMARTIAAEAAPGADLAFARVSRAVRQTIALDARLDEGRRKRVVADANLRAYRQRERVRRFVTRAIEADADDSDVEDLIDDLHERLDDYEPLFTDRPVPEIILRICKDLGVTPDPSLLDDEDWGLPPDPHPHLPREAAGGGPFAEERTVEGASPPTAPAAFPLHPPLSAALGGRSPSRHRDRDEGG